MIVLLIIVPLLAGVAAFLVRSQVIRRQLLVGAAGTHLGLSCLVSYLAAAPVWGGWLALDASGSLILILTSALFLLTSVAAVGYLRREAQAVAHEKVEESWFTNTPEAVFIGCLLLFLAAMTLVTVSQHFGLIWIAVEATTLASAPLIFFHRHPRSLEATWKYLLVCSVGIALALLGTFFLGVAAAQPNRSSWPLLVPDLVKHAAALHPQWLKAAFLFLLVGYGTKMGLAPMHTWLPDAHSEAPSVISALLSGALLNCAFLGILRINQVCVAAGLAGFGQSILVVFGLGSMAVAAVFILGQTDFKRLLAYSSVEHMGIMALGLGLGGAGVFGALLHAISHSLTKAMLFLLAGNILDRYRTKAIAQVRGLVQQMPFTGVLWLAGFLAITGTPPFGLFISKLIILKSAIDQGYSVAAVVYVGLLAIIFVGMATAFLGMAQGESQEIPARNTPLNWWSLVPATLFAGLVLVLGIHIPSAVSGLLHDAARQLGGL